MKKSNMDTTVLTKRFAEMGARVQVTQFTPNPFRRTADGIDIRSDRRGEYFDIRIRTNDEVDYDVIDVRPDLRHLLLMARRENGKQKFLCGHDERHWFVCAVPGEAVTNVVKAMEALQPRDVRVAVSRRVKRVKNRLRRRNKAFVRQGEWFFVRAESIDIDAKLTLRNEPLSRGGGSKPHMCQFLYRSGSTFVMVCYRYRQGVSEDRYREILSTTPGARHWGWTRMMREPTVYVRGRVWHPDHKTIVLNDWHRVLMNTEREAPGARAVVFLD